MAELRQRGIRVHGDLADLVTSWSSPTGPDLDDVGDAELLAATEAALVSLALDHGRLFRRYRQAFVEREGRLPGAVEVLGSEARAGGFWLRRKAVGRADHHPIVARAARTYLGRTSPSSRSLPEPDDAARLLDHFASAATWERGSAVLGIVCALLAIRVVREVRSLVRAGRTAEG